MSEQKVIRSLSFIAVLLVLWSTTLVAQPGTTGITFLKLGVSARGAAMAEALSATATGAEAAFYNPAGLAVFANISRRQTQALVTHREWIQDTRVQFLGTRIVLGNAEAIGVSLTHATVSDIQVRTRPGQAEGTFSARYLSFGLSYARSLSDLLTVGLSGKFLYEKIFVDEASGFAADIGVHLNLPIEGLKFGMLVANLGSMSTLRNAATSLPAVLRTGAAYVADIPEISSQLTVATDFYYYFRSRESVEALGVELVFDQQFALRVGYQFGSETRGVAAGIGLRFSILGLDYAYAPIALDLGNTHTITVSALL